MLTFYLSNIFSKYFVIAEGLVLICWLYSVFTFSCPSKVCAHAQPVHRYIWPLTFVPLGDCSVIWHGKRNHRPVTLATTWSGLWTPWTQILLFGSLHLKDDDWTLHTFKYIDIFHADICVSHITLWTNTKDEQCNSPFKYVPIIGQVCESTMFC